VNKLVQLEINNLSLKKRNDMIDLKKYTDLDKTVIFSNGKEFELFSKPTKKGKRYFYYSCRNMRMMPISKIEAGIL